MTQLPRVQSIFASVVAPALTLALGLGFVSDASAAPSAGASASVGGGGVSGSTASAMGGNRFRLHVDGEFFGFGHYNPDGGADDDGTNYVGFGVGRGLSTHVGNNLGFGGGGAPLMGIGFGVLILNNNAIVGARTGMSLLNTRQQDSDGHATAFGGELLPYFRYMFLQAPIRPFVEGHIGFGGALVKGTDIILDQEVSVTGHVISPIVGAAGGAMFFLNEHFSIDVGLNFDYLAPHTRTTFSDGDGEDTDWDKAGDLITLTVNTGISGWF